MKAAVLAALLALPAVAQDSKQPVDVELQTAYRDCTEKYVNDRFGWDVAPDDLADGAVGWCAKEHNAMVQSLFDKDRDSEKASRIVDRVVLTNRYALVGVIIELRNKGKH